MNENNTQNMTVLQNLNYNDCSVVLIGTVVCEWMLISHHLQLNSHDWLWDSVRGAPQHPPTPHGIIWCVATWLVRRPIAQARAMAKLVMAWWLPVVGGACKSNTTWPMSMRKSIASADQTPLWPIISWGSLCSFQVVRKIGHARSVTENIRETLASIFRSTLLLSKGNLNIKSEYLQYIKRLLENENRFPLPSSIIDVVVLASRNERRWNNAYEYRYARLQRWWRAFPTPIYQKVRVSLLGLWRLLQDLHRIHQRNSRWMHQLS